MSISNSQEEPVEELLISLHSSISPQNLPKVLSALQTFAIPQSGPYLDSQTLSHAQTSPDLLVLMFEYSFGLQTQEVVELLTFKTFELQLLNTISFIAQILTLGITNSSDIVAEYSSAGQITFSKSMLELDKTNELTLTKLIY
ncbi:hypothetical protein BLNAU_24186 [Blattamonas nauphoetae]|uniref:Uncharacterized protein n=1 Tax=Blattamonas nauphoetae TaxID=2049346 RepID=A0ABQ9WS90_9EUKA|nr:hypothetical protein BLNAU_24186 [Blattamonas nauphoetae]